HHLDLLSFPTRRSSDLEARGPHRHAAGRLGPSVASLPPTGRVAVSVWAAILAGGSGTRFWPLSTPQRPKQFLPLAGDRPLLVQADRKSTRLNSRSLAYL